MRLSCNLCTLMLVNLGIFGGVYAFSGFDILLFLCLGSEIARRAFLSVCFVAALFDVYALLVFKPYKGLK